MITKQKFERAVHAMGLTCEVKRLGRHLDIVIDAPEGMRFANDLHALVTDSKMMDAPHSDHAAYTAALVDAKQQFPLMKCEEDCGCYEVAEVVA